MKSRLRVGLKGCFACLWLGMGMACENPGPDPGLGQGYPRKAVGTAVFEGKPFLQFDLRQDSAGTSLRIINKGLSTIDSASFLLRLAPDYAYAWGQDGYFLPADFEHYGKAGSLRPGEGMDLGIIDASPQYELDRELVGAWMIGVTVDGRPAGFILQGVYHGDYQSMDTSGYRQAGKVAGFIGADGTGFLELRGMLVSKGGVLRLFTREDATLASVTALGNLNSFTVREDGSRFRAAGAGWEGSFAFSENMWLDSLSLQLQPFSPQKK